MKRVEVAAMSPLRSALCHFLAAFVGICVVTPPVIMLLDRRAPIAVEEISISPNPARPGDTMTMRWLAREFRDCGGTVIRRFIGSDHIIRETVQLPVVFHDRADGTPKAFEVRFQLPHLPPGEAIYQGVVLRYCNVVQKILWPIVYYAPPVKFMVAEP